MDVAGWSAVAGVGGAVMGKLEHIWETRHNAQKQDQRERQEMFWAICGRPATPFQSEQKGLLTLVADLSRNLQHHLDWHEEKGDRIPENHHAD